MASYGIIYEFLFSDINGDDVNIFILKKNYTGSRTQRAVGRAPMLKRERNGSILGTSLEIYAECKIDGEFAELYTSSADEFRVNVYKSRNLIWQGYISPELYSEPDIAPPYDVQIIATDGLGELKNHSYRLLGNASLKSHIQHALEATALPNTINLISSLSWDDDTSANSPGHLLNMMTDLSHMAEESCYEVLQSILTSLNACITQQNGAWMIIRESDLYLNTQVLPSAIFGSKNTSQWWPIGNLSIDIMPAKKEVSIIHENQYRENILPPISMGVVAGWETGVGCYYSAAEGGWIIPSQAGLSYKIDSHENPFQADLLLRVKARCLAKEGETAASKLSVYMERTYNGNTYYLARDYLSDEDRVTLYWSNAMMGYVYAWDAPVAEQDVEPEMHDIEVLIPIKGGSYAESLDITIGNPYPSPYLLCIYSIELMQAEQTRGSKVTVSIANGAREKLNEIKVSLASSSDSSLPELQYGVLRLNGGVDEWHTPSISATGLLSFIAKDVAMQHALPRMRYRGKLNVPSNVDDSYIPILFRRDDAYYFLNTYSHDLLNSELEVELISIPNAQLQIESETVIELPVSGSPSSSSGGSTGGGGTSGGGSDIVVDSVMSDTSTNPVQNKVIKEYVDLHPQYEVIEEVLKPELPVINLADYATKAWVRDQGYAYSLNTSAMIAALEERIAAIEKMLEGTGGESGCYFIPAQVVFEDGVLSVSYERVGVMTEPLTIKTTAKIIDSIPCTKESTVSSSLANLVTMFNADDLSVVFVKGNEYTVDLTVVTSDSNGSTTKTGTFKFIA
jgi:hypothetical protein